MTKTLRSTRSLLRQDVPSRSAYERRHNQESQTSVCEHQVVITQALSLEQARLFFLRYVAAHPEVLLKAAGVTLTVAVGQAGFMAKKVWAPKK